MTKTIFNQYNVPARSFTEMERFQGLFQPGVYRGYDEFIADGDPNVGSEFFPVKLIHSATGFLKVDDDDVLASDPCGAVVFPNGFILQDTDELELQIDFNQDGTSRFNPLVAQLNYVKAADATTVTIFTLSSGTYNPSTGVVTLPNPEIQVVIGIIEVVAGGESIAGLVWHRRPAPPLANANALLYPGINTLATKAEAKMKADFTDQILAFELMDYTLRMGTIMMGTTNRLVTIQVTMNSALNEVPLTAIVPSAYRPEAKVLKYIDHTDFGGTGKSHLQVYPNGNIIFENDHNSQVNMVISYLR